MSKRSTTDYDRLLGERIRAARIARGWTQSDLGRALDLTFQQVQKYELGSNRVAVATLVRIAGALNVTVDQLMPKTGADCTPLPDPFSGLGTTVGGHELARLYSRMDAPAQKSLLNVAQAIVGGQAAMQAAAG